MIMWYNYKNENDKTIYITLTEEHLQLIDKLIITRLINSYEDIIRKYIFEINNLEHKLKSIETVSVSDYKFLKYERFQTHIEFFESYILNDDPFLMRLKGDIRKYGSVTIDSKNINFIDGAKTIEELNEELRKLEQEKNKYSERHMKLCDEYREKLKTKREEIENQIVTNRPPPPCNKNETGYRGPDHGIDNIVTLVLIVGLIILGMAFGFYTMGN